MTGHDRAVLYRVGIETGLRRGALEALKVGDFDLGEDPLVKVPARHGTKNTRPMTIPLKRQTARILKDYFAGRLLGLCR